MSGKNHNDIRAPGQRTSCGSPLVSEQGDKRSNVKCMYCNKDVQLKQALVILLERFGSYASALLKVLNLPPPFTLFHPV